MKRRRLHRGDRVLFKRQGRDLDLALAAGAGIFARCTAARTMSMWIARSCNTGVPIGILSARTEGTVWCRGWTGEDARALRAANVME